MSIESLKLFPGTAGALARFLGMPHSRAVTVHRELREIVT